MHKRTHVYTHAHQNTHVHVHTHTYTHIYTYTHPYRNSSFIPRRLRTLTKRPVLFYVYSLWYVSRNTQVDASVEMTDSQEDMNQKESHETVAD